MMWHPIETAPRDHTPLLLACRGHWVWPGWWSGHTWTLMDLRSYTRGQEPDVWSPWPEPPENVGVNDDPR